MYFRSGGRNEKNMYAYSYMTSMKFLELKCDGKNTCLFFQKHKFNYIAIYGTDEFAKFLYQDLIASNVHICCFIDKEFSKFPEGYLGIPVVDVQNIDSYCNVDIIVITPIYDCNQIMDDLIENHIPLDKIININDVVYGMEE